MRTIFGSLVAAAFVATSSSAAAQSRPQSQSHSMSLWTGTWKLNIAQSKYDPGPPPQPPASNVVTLDIVNGLLRITTNQVNAQGQPFQTIGYISFDGKEQAIISTLPTAPPATRLAKWIDERTYEFTNRVDGQVTTTTRLELARDGKTHTLTTTGKNAQGQTVDNVTLFEKQ